MKSSLNYNEIRLCDCHCDFSSLLRSDLTIETSRDEFMRAVGALVGFARKSFRESDIYCSLMALWALEALKDSDAFVKFSGQVNDYERLGKFVELLYKYCL